MYNVKKSSALAALLVAMPASSLAADDWVIDSQNAWTAATSALANLQIKDGLAVPSGEVATLTPESEAEPQDGA